MKHLLTIAGSDSSGGAGIQADLKTFAAHGTFGMSVITAVTAQNTQGVTMVQDIDAEVVEAQINAVFDDIRVDAVKIGMVSHPEIIKTIAGRLRYYKPQIVVLDPVMISKSGYPLLAPEACETLVKELLPLGFARSRSDQRHEGGDKGRNASGSCTHFRAGSPGGAGQRRAPERQCRRPAV